MITTHKYLPYIRIQTDGTNYMEVDLPSLSMAAFDRHVTRPILSPIQMRRESGRIRLVRRLPDNTQY